jgi:hypothetical protein
MAALTDIMNFKIKNCKYFFEFLYIRLNNLQFMERIKSIICLKYLSCHPFDSAARNDPSVATQLVCSKHVARSLISQIWDQRTSCQVIPGYIAVTANLKLSNFLLKELCFLNNNQGPLFGNTFISCDR